MSLRPVWPLRCDQCRTAWTYPRATSLSGAYLQASLHGWAIAIYIDTERADELTCPRCQPIPGRFPATDERTTRP